MNPAATIQELRNELNELKTYTAHDRFTARVLMLIAESLVGWMECVQVVDRINKLEQETKELRERLASARKEAVDNIEEVRQFAESQIPKLQDGKLVFETGDGEGNLVYGHVLADIQHEGLKI